MAPASERSLPVEGTVEGMSVRGRQGSPTVTVAFPFSTVHVEANDSTAEALAELAGIVTGIADAAGRPEGAGRSAELARLAVAARALEARLCAPIERRSPSAEGG